jgi:hypothetical protein
MALSREQFVAQFAISFGVHCLRQWPKRRNAAPIHLTACLYEWIRTSGGRMAIGPAEFARLAEPVIEELHRTTPKGERPEWNVVAARLHDALVQAEVEINLESALRKKGAPAGD